MIFLIIFCFEIKLKIVSFVNFNRKMKKMNKLFLSVVLLLLLSSCKNFVPYTEALKTKYKLTESDLKQVQFYNSEAIILHRKFVEGSSEIAGGKIKTVNGEKIEEIIIPAKTKGVLTKYNADGKVEVSFEKSDDYFLRFGANPNRENQFVVLATDWQNKSGKVYYNGQLFFTAPESIDAILLVDMRRIMKSEQNTRIAKGRKIK